MTKELIERFFSKECTSEEAKEVAAYLKANPAVLEEYLSAEEWDSIIAGDVAIQNATWNETWQNINRSNRKRAVVQKLKRTAVAASVIVVAMAIVYYSTFDNPKQKQVVDVKPTPVNKPQQQAYKIVKNDTRKALRIVLYDKSVVDLLPASSIQYDTTFGIIKRDILLMGEARFTVAKNKTKPFTVYAGGFTTTALGTVFTVKNNDAAKTFSVKLSEGKVVVHLIGNHVAGWQQDVYLTPGETLQFNKLSGELAINKPAEQKPAIAVKTVPLKHTIDSTYDRLNFNNATLPEVMYTLKGWFSINILYDSAAINTMNFSGLISRYDSPETILKVITQANGLDVSKTDTAFIIYKP